MPRTNTATARTASAAVSTAAPDTSLPPPVLPDELGAATVASILQVQSRTVSTWIRSGKLRAHKKVDAPNSPWVILKADFKEFYNKHYSG